MDPALSIVVVTRGPALQLARFLRSLGRARGTEDAELLLAVEDDSALEGAHRLLSRYAPSIRARVFELPETPPALARTMLVARSAAAVLVFFDDDVEVPPSFLPEAKTIMGDGAAAAGGPNLTPAAGGTFEQIVGRVLGSALGSGPVRHRYRPSRGVEGSERTLILCNLAVKHSAFAEGAFAPHIEGANENELLTRLVESGAEVVYDERLAVYHHRRETLAAHLKQMAKYGFGRGQMLVHSFRLRDLAYTLPTVALVAFAVLAAFAPRVAATVLLLYLLVLVGGSLAITRPRHAPTAFVVYLATHVGYALGVLVGVPYAVLRRVAGERAPRLSLWRW